MPDHAPSFDDFLPLTRLYERFDAVASGRERGTGVDVHAAVLERLERNRARAEALGWTECALERLGGSGRLVSRGLRPGGLSREALPDWVPGPGSAPTRDPRVAAVEQT